ncbi:MAG: sugar phosphate isomerase/epimerase [Eubacteriales bacterium]
MDICVFFEHIKQVAADMGGSVSDAVSAVLAAGITSIDIDMNEAKLDPGAFRLTVEACGMNVASCYGFVTLKTADDIPAAENFIDIARAAGAHNAMILPGQADDMESRGELLHAVAPLLSRLASYASDRGLTLSLENFSNILAPYSLISDFEYLLDACPELGFTLDTGNFAFNGESPLTAYERLGSRITHVHLKNWDIPERRIGEAPMYIAASGEPLYPYPIKNGGLIDIASILTSLKRDGYKRSLSIENFGVSPMLKGLSESAAYIRSLI